MKSIGSNIRRVRELKGLSRIQLADKLNLSERGYGKIENGEVSITLEKLQIISDSLEVDPLKLLQFDENYVFNNCCKNSSIVNNGIVNNGKSTQLLDSMNELIYSLKEQIRIKDELIDLYQKDNK